VTGAALALPLIALAGSTHVGDAAFDDIFHPIARRLLERCDAVLRVGGASAGADEMAELARSSGKLGTTAPFGIAPATALTHLVTEPDAPTEALEPFAELGLHVVR